MGTLKMNYSEKKGQRKTRMQKEAASNVSKKRRWILTGRDVLSDGKIHTCSQKDEENKKSYS